MTHFCKFLDPGDPFGMLRTIEEKNQRRKM
jgi:hypothetical protein